MGNRRARRAPSRRSSSSSIVGGTPHAISKENVINDIHVANLYADKSFAEAEVPRLRSENRNLTAEVGKLTSQLHIAFKDAVDAESNSLSQLPDHVGAMNERGSLLARLKGKHTQSSMLL